MLKALQELNQYNPKYNEDMTHVFEKCQEMENKRLKFFKEMLFGIHKCLDVSKDPKLREIYDSYWRQVELADASQDLRWWAQNHGTGMPMNWPIYEVEMKLFLEFFIHKFIFLDGVELM